MKNYRHYMLLLLILAVTSMPLFTTGCANEVNKRIEIAKDLYRQSIEYKRANKPIRAENKLKEALREYQTIIVNFPNRSNSIASTLYQIWEQNYKQANYKAASLVFGSIVKNFPESLWTQSLENTLWLIAYDEKDKHNYEEARRAYQELVDNFPDSDLTLTTLYDLGKVNYQLEDYENARKVFREFLVRHSKKGYSVNAFVSKDARRLIAQSYLDQRFKDYHQAYLNFDKLTTAVFKNDIDLQAEAMYKTAYCLKQLKDNDEALGRYTEFMTRFPDSEYVTNAYLDLGDFYSYNKKDYELARFNYKRALKSADDSDRTVEIQYKIGGTYYDEGNLEKAIAAYNVILQKYPESKNFVNAKTMIAHIHSKENRVDEAINVHTDIIENHADNKIVNRIITIVGGIDAGFPVQLSLSVASYAQIGEAYFGEDNFKKAFESYARIVKKTASDEQDFRKDPYAPFALYKAMETLCKLGRKDELETFATTYIEAFGNTNILSGSELILSAEAQRKFADVLREELAEKPEQYDKAATEYAKLQDYPPKPYLRLNLIKLRGKYYEGLCYEKGKTPDKSVEAYQEAIRMFDAIFQPLIDIPNIQHNITKEEFDYCIQTAKEYVKKIRRKLKAPKTNLGDGIGKAEDSSDENITSIALASTVFLNLNLNNGTGYGSGFFVGHDLIATNYHVIKGAIEGTARLVKTGMTYAIVGYTAVDPEQDLAILKDRAFDVKPLSLGNSNNVEINDNVYAVGSPLGQSDLQGTVSQGKISGVRTYSTGKLLQMTTPISPGNSGGPVLSSKGKVVGVAVSQVLYRDPKYLVNRAQNLNFAVPVNDLKVLLERVGPLKPLSDLEVVN